MTIEALRIADKVGTVKNTIIPNTFFVLGNITSNYTDSSRPDLRKIEREWDMLQAGINILYDYMLEIKQELESISEMMDAEQQKDN